MNEIEISKSKQMAAFFVLFCMFGALCVIALAIIFNK